MNDALKNEKQQRDKLQRERDELAAEKYTADQELKVLMAYCIITCLCGLFHSCLVVASAA